jgi:hypothetical protein
VLTELHQLHHTHTHKKKSVRLNCITFHTHKRNPFDSIASPSIPTKEIRSTQLHHLPLPTKEIRSTQLHHLPLPTKEIRSEIWGSCMTSSVGRKRKERKKETQFLGMEQGHKFTADGVGGMETHVCVRLGMALRLSNSL